MLPYMQLSIMTSQRTVENLIAKSWRVVKVYDESNHNNVFLERLDASIRHSICDYWAIYPHANLTYIAFHADSLFALEKGSRNATTNTKGDNPSKSFQKKSWNRASANNMSTVAWTSPKHKSHTRSRSQSMFRLHTFSSQMNTSNETPSSL